MAGRAAKLCWLLSMVAVNAGLLQALDLGSPISLRRPGGGNSTKAEISYSKKRSIIVFHKEPNNGHLLLHICGKNGTKSAWAAQQLPAYCRLAPGTCKRVYTTTLIGAAGNFTIKELMILATCMPGGIKYKEADGKVQIPSIHRDESTEDAEDASAAPTAGGKRRKVLQQPMSLSTPMGIASPRSPTGSGGFGASLPTSNIGITGMTPPQPMGSGLPSPQATTSNLMPSATPAAEADKGPRVGLGQEEFRSAATWQNVISNPTSNATTAEVREALKKFAYGRPNGVLWNLDRIDQRHLPLDHQYRYGSLDSSGTGKGVTVYVVDSGVRLTHQEFVSDLTGQRRATFGIDYVGNFTQDSPAHDCDGHGTHVAATAVGRNVGVAKEANVVAVRVLDCEGTGTISDLVAGLDWVGRVATPPAVATLSLGVPVGEWSRSLEESARGLIRQFNISVVVASGNSDVDSCYIAPADVGETISVAGSDLATKFNKTSYGDVEGFYSYSNTGSCVDIFAPGVDIYSACGGTFRCAQVNDSSYTWGSGTSMAAPHVAGVVAMYLQDHPNAQPAEVKSVLIAAATKATLNLTGARPGTPNRLLCSDLQGNDFVTASSGPPTQNTTSVYNSFSPGAP
ncbi:probable aqualysin-1 at C-terminar half [Coccomyxa sp. Obi]|nr:probable aqualysin-1 at C-terminar half [Coccomyxa sp. Obi]